jgi:hypothetical protein
MTRYLYDLDQHAELQRTAKLDNWLIATNAVFGRPALGTSGLPAGWEHQRFEGFKNGQSGGAGGTGHTPQIRRDGHRRTVGVAKNRSVQVMKFQYVTLQYS